MRPLSVQTLTEKARFVLRGKVGSKTVQRDQSGRIFTQIELEVTEVWKGSGLTNRFTLVQGGGVLGERREVVSGQAELSIGEDVVLFLVQNERGEGVILGLSQGKFDVTKDDRSEELLTRNPFHGSPAPKTRGATTSLKSNGDARLTLSDLRQRVTGGAK